MSEYLIIYHFITQEFGAEIISVVQPLGFVAGVAVDSVSADPLTLLFWGFAMFQAVAIPWTATCASARPAPAQPA